MNTKNNFKITAFFKPSLARNELELDCRVGSTSARQMKGVGDEVTGLKRGGVGVCGKDQAKMDVLDYVQIGPKDYGCQKREFSTNT